MNEGLFIVVSGPSGAGKTTLVQRVLRECKTFQKPVSYTTRAPLQNEAEGQAYYFVSQREFQKLRRQGSLVEWAKVYGQFYGTSVEEVRRIWGKGLSIIKDLDLQGMQSVKKAFSRVVTVFIAPPSLEVLEKRLTARGRETDISRSLRLSEAQNELAGRKYCDHSIVNQNLETAFAKLKKIIEKAQKL